jgi:hypothetical protein
MPLISAIDILKLSGSTRKAPSGVTSETEGDLVSKQAQSCLLKILFGRRLTKSLATFSTAGARYPTNPMQYTQ